MTAIEKLAFESGEEALAHGVIIGVSNRTHRGTHAGLAAAMAELDRGVLRTLIGVMDHPSGWSPQQRHVQGIKHQLPGERAGHRPADDAAAKGVEHDGEVDKARPGRDVGNVGDPQPVRRLRGEVALDQVGRLTTIALDRGGDELASAHTGKTGLRHQPGDTLAANMDPLGRQFGMNPRCAIGAARARMRGADLGHQRRVRPCPPRRLAFRPRVIAAGGDTQQPAHGGDRVVRLVIAHEPEPFGGIAFVS